MGLDKVRQGSDKTPNNIIYSIGNTTRKVLMELLKYKDEEGFVRLDKVTIKEICEKLGIARSTFWYHIDKLIRFGILQYIDTGLYRFGLGVPPWSQILISEPQHKQHVLEPSIISPNILRSALKVLFDKIRVHNFRISFSLRYSIGNKVIDDDIGTIVVQGNTLQLFLKAYESDDILEGLRYFTRTILRYPYLINYLNDKYKFFVNDISHIYVEISFVYRDNITIPIDYGISFDFDYYNIAYKRDKSTGKWELELIINVDSDNIEKALECINFMNVKVLWDLIIYTANTQKQILANTQEILQKLEEIKRKLENASDSDK